MRILTPKPFFFNAGTKAVILLHSFSGTSNDMRLMGRMLERNGYSAYAPMFMGHGTDEPIDILDQGGPDQWWQQVNEAVDFLKEQRKNEIYIFGLSLGAIFATKAVEEIPEIKAGGVFGSPVLAHDFSNVRDAFMTYAEKAYEIREVSEIEKYANLRTIDSRIDAMLMNIRKTTAGVGDKLAEIEKPYFIGQGMRDKMVDPEAAKQVAQIVKTADFHQYDAGHVLTINRAHKELEGDVLNFLENIEDRNA
ncbi:alpha/beta hydrolase [Companilactobacillus hulinensis]|uniref:alpha/beta hydrolase n=1 Tax=Companilactobacillus hulinensis TaxID=2486007 RepID=UPI000F7A2B80|nr:alpha/beta fold hydrolase [Companilactobacillus hulinensis]